MTEIKPEGTAWADAIFALPPAEELCRKVWRFGSSRRAEPFAPVVLLLANGRVGGYIHANEHRWTLGDAALQFRRNDWFCTTTFDRMQTNASGQIRLLGRHTTDATVEHYLEERDPPQRLCTEESGATFEARITGSARRNLVVLCANRNSLHPAWLDGAGTLERSWDLCLSFYGPREDFPPPPPFEYLAWQPRTPKFIGLHRLFHAGSPLWQYDRVWLPDDDLATNLRDINRLFEICDEYGLQIAQPALTKASFVTHHVTRQHRGSQLRFTTFVEIMAPLFKREALAICAPTFENSQSGWGLDHVWPRLLGLPRTGMAVIDEIAVTHTRPVAANYDRTSARAEVDVVNALYNAHHRAIETGLLHAKDRAFDYSKGQSDADEPTVLVNAPALPSGAGA
jgi:hypothetical protein